MIIFYIVNIIALAVVSMSNEYADSFLGKIKKNKVYDCWWMISNLWLLVIIASLIF